ncbi:Proteinase inhibitor I4 serpin [Candidatus Sulfopaludibacter sp. SbA4]|nr:Proteinase inhibitor I4 serpin [Candidatus Sulfopaludibacter sp. SbA4]
MSIPDSIRRFTLALLLAGGLHAADGAAPGSNSFATRIYRQLAGGHGNLILSPSNIATALSMALQGARGQTADEMAAVLDQLPPEAAMDQLLKDANTGGNQLLTANALWVQHGFPILSDFQQTMETRFRAPLSPLDFSGNPEQARAAINSWTEQHTKGKIRELFGPGSLNASNRLVLTSAIYFYGKWQSAFPAVATKPEPFRLVGSATVQASFMHQTATFGYAETPSAQILEMKYAGTPVVFDVVLPKADAGIGDVDTTIDPGKLAEWLGAIHPRTVEVALPKFRAESAFSLKETLAQMGMRSAFTGQADFSGIDGRRDLALSRVEHKAFVDVSEEGTEAAAATGVAVALVAMKSPPRTVFRADHPFLFLIRDTRSGTILFDGRLMNPKP